MRILFTTIFLIFSHFLAKSQEPDSVRGAAFFDAGMEFYKTQQYNEAIVEFTKATQVFGEEYVAGHAKSLEWIGYGYLRLSENDKMIEFFKKAEPYAQATLEKHGDYKPIINNQMMLSMMLEQVNDGKEALKHFEKLEKLLLENELNYTYLSIIYQSRARIAMNNLDFGPVSSFLEKSVEFAKKSENRRQLIATLHTSQTYFYELGNLKKAKQISDETIALATKEFGATGSDLARYLSARAGLDYVRQEYEMAMDWIDRAIEISTDPVTYFTASVATNYYYKANLLLNKESYEIAIQYYDKALKEYDNNTLHLDLIVASLDGKLRSLAYLKNKDQILVTIDEIQAQMTRTDIKKLTEANALLAIAFGYRAIQNYEMAIEYLNKVIQMVDEDYKGTSVPLYLAYYEYSILELDRGNTMQAGILIDKAIAANKREMKGEEYYISAQSNAELLIHKSKILQADEKPEEALAILETGFDRIQSERALLVGTEYSMEAIGSLRNSALDLCYELFKKTEDVKYFEKAFRIGELTKSQQLNQWVNESVNSKSGAIDSTLFTQRNNLLNDISTLERLVISESDLASSTSYSDSLFSLKTNLYEVSQNIKIKHPKFYTAIYEGMNIDLDNTLKSLDQDEHLLSYSLSENSAYLMILGTEKDFIKLERDGLEAEIDKFRSMLMNPAEDNLHDISKKLFERLLPIDQKKLTQKLNIVADGVLAYLPFELLSKDGSTYLMEKHVVTYSYSANTLKPFENSFSKEGFIAFAPDFGNTLGASNMVRKKLSNLPGALEEVKAINQIQKGRLFSDTSATETNFRKFSDRMNLVHLATHAIVDDRIPNQSRLVFNTSNDSIDDGYLHAYEIYNLDLNAQLVTLSACNTGFGKIKKGEGVMSLSRAFAYAGVPATVVSLWPASDKSTPELMKYFYQNLKDGQAKDEALNNARKQYLAKAKGKARHPFYWGGFVLIGDNSPLEEERNLLVYLIPTTLVFVMIITVYRRKRIKIQ